MNWIWFVTGVVIGVIIGALVFMLCGAIRILKDNTPTNSVDIPTKYTKRKDEVEE